MSTASELIRRIDFFQPLDDRLIDRIARLCIPREYSPGDYIVRQGDPGLGLYFITSGSARVEITRDGATTPIADLNAGEFVGELSIIDKKPRSANVVCVTDASCLLLTRDSFTRLLNKHPEIALQMAKALAARLRSTDERMWQGTVAVGRVPVPASQETTVPDDIKPLSDTGKIKDMLADAVSWVFLMKAVTKFSLAVVGCPVTVQMETKASESFVTAIGPLKIIVFPAGEDHVIGVHAFDDGAFKATLLRPGLIRPGLILPRLIRPGLVQGGLPSCMILDNVRGAVPRDRDGRPRPACQELVDSNYRRQETGLSQSAVTVSHFHAPVRRSESVFLRIPASEGRPLAAGPGISDLTRLLDL